MTEELFNHLKQVEPGRTSLPICFFRRTLGDEQITALKIPQKRTTHAGSAGKYAREMQQGEGTSHAGSAGKYDREMQLGEEKQQNGGKAGLDLG